MYLLYSQQVFLTVNALQLLQNGNKAIGEDIKRKKSSEWKKVSSTNKLKMEIL
jgi:hypothetical protein